MKLPLSLQVLARRAAAAFGPLLSPLTSGYFLTSQEVTRQPAFPVAKYKQISEITAACRQLTWTQDPLDGKLDHVRHPTYMQRAINERWRRSGDCDEFAAYWAAALMKNSLADEVWYGTAMWASGDKIVGHAICVYRVDDTWYWAGNWKNCNPIVAGELREGWIAGMEAILGTRVFAAAMWPLALRGDDTLLFGKQRIIRI